MRLMAKWAVSTSFVGGLRKNGKQLVCFPYASRRSGLRVERCQDAQDSDTCASWRNALKAHVLRVVTCDQIEWQTSRQSTKNACVL